MKRLLVIALLSLAAAAMAADEGAINEKLIERFEADLTKAPFLTPMLNATTNNSIRDLALNREKIIGHDKLFNVEVKGTGIIDQQASGRCWIFAGANVVAPKVMTKLNQSDFELSQAYVAFWDKLEKSNIFMEKMIAFRDRDLDDRSLQNYLDWGIGDGGWWNYFQTLVNKYGVVPASVMPETKQSAGTGVLNGLLNSKLRQATANIRDMHQAGKGVRELRMYKEQVLSEIYRLLVLSYGEPPKEFTFRWEYKPKKTEKDSSAIDVGDEASVIEQTFTPKSFMDEFFGGRMAEYAAISHNPAKEYGKLYRMEDGRNVQEVADMEVVNLSIEKLKEYTIKSLMDSQIVWFACDVGKDNFRDSGLFAVNVYDYNSAFGINFDVEKEDRIKYGDMSPNHAMVITAVDTADGGAPRKWKVENSWGTKTGDKGYWTMLDDWFDEYVLLVMVDKRLLDESDAALWDQEPVVVEDWEPFFRSLTRLR